MFVESFFLSRWISSHAFIDTHWGNPPVNPRRVVHSRKLVMKMHIRILPQRSALLPHSSVQRVVQKRLSQSAFCGPDQIGCVAIAFTLAFSNVCFHRQNIYWISLFSGSSPFSSFSPLRQKGKQPWDTRSFRIEYFLASTINMYFTLRRV